MNTLIYLAITFIVAYFCKNTISKLHLPHVTAYVIVGMFLGCSMLNLYSATLLNSLSIVADLALGIIAFSIGVELKREIFRSLGKPIIYIVILEVLCTFVLVTVAMFFFFSHKIYLALILGAVASATAPAATVTVIQQYRSRGPLTSTILAVVGIDDAIALIIYVFASIFAGSVLKHTAISLRTVVYMSISEICIAIICGSLVSFAYSSILRKKRNEDDILIGVAACIILLMGLSETFHFSGLLSVMMYGLVLTNTNPHLANRAQKRINYISPVIIPLFFILAGARLDISLLPAIGVAGLLYTVVRAFGKIAGARIGATLGDAPEAVKKYIGLSLLPQVGVAVALALAVKKEFGSGLYGVVGVNLANIVINILLFTTIITELVGPILTKFALSKAGEVNKL